MDCSPSLSLSACVICSSLTETECISPAKLIKQGGQCRWPQCQSSLVSKPKRQPVKTSTRSKGLTPPITNSQPALSWDEPNLSLQVFSQAPACRMFPSTPGLMLPRSNGVLLQEILKMLSMPQFMPPQPQVPLMRCHLEAAAHAGPVDNSLQWLLQLLCEEFCKLLPLVKFYGLMIHF